jgi:uncharacterized membrane protein YdjX (TVP38/TMEM64 family)
MIENWISWAQANPFTPILIIAIYLAGTFTFFPTVMLFILSVHFFGPLLGTLYALAGISCSAAISFLIGRHIGLSVLDRIPFLSRKQAAVDQLNESMQNKGVWWVAALRNTPIAPFTVVNVAVGTTAIPFIDFLLGNALGVLPTLLAIVFFEEKVIAAVENKDFSIALPALFVIALLYGLSRLARRITANSSNHN